jgi:hypothetical protein
MTKILKAIKSSSTFTKYLIAKNSDVNCEDWVEVCIDKTKNLFTAEKIKLKNIGNEWIEFNDYTFPSSLLNEFLNSD